MKSKQRINKNNSQGVNVKPIVVAGGLGVVSTAVASFEWRVTAS